MTDKNDQIPFENDSGLMDTQRLLLGVDPEKGRDYSLDDILAEYSSSARAPAPPEEAPAPAPAAESPPAPEQTAEETEAAPLPEPEEEDLSEFIGTQWMEAGEIGRAHV